MPVKCATHSPLPGSQIIIIDLGLQSQMTYNTITEELVLYLTAKWIRSGDASQGCDVVRV